MANALYLIDNILVIAGFLSVVASTLVYGVVGAFTKGTEWYATEYGRMVILRDLALGVLLYKNVTSVIGGRLSHDPGYEWANIAVGLMMIYQLVVTVRMVITGTRIKREREALK